MYALIENEQFVKILNERKGFTGLGNNIEIVDIINEEGEITGTEEVVTQQEVKYSKDVFTKWTNEEREAIGIYEVQVDNTNKKDEAYYINTDISYSFDGSSVIGSYGTPTAKPLDDVLFVEGDEIPSDKAVGDIKQYGLKGQKISIIKQQAGGLLAPTDWQVIKEMETSDYVVPTAITDYRSAVRSKSNEMENQINACTTVDELKALYEYSEDAEGNITRPLAEFPKEVI
jgi:hypothetical protein